MLRGLAVGALVLLPAFAAAPERSTREVVTDAVIGPEDNQLLRASTFLYTEIILPKGEKAVSVDIGDPNFWEAKFIEGAERFVMVKPSKAGRPSTNLHILTDHENTYSFDCHEVSSTPGEPIDVKIIVRPREIHSAEGPPKLYTAAAVEQLKKQADDSQKEISDVKARAKEDEHREEIKIRSELPKQLHFNYRFDRGKDPINIQQVWDDGKFTYVKAYPRELATFYEVADGKPMLVESSYDRDGGIYIIRKLIKSGYFQIGKAKQEVFQVKAGG